MSKFIDKLHNLSKISVLPIGFHAANSIQEGSPMLLVARLNGAGIRSVKAITGSNVDAGLIWEQGLGVGNLKRMIKAMEDIPLGVVVKEAARERIIELVGIGCDFIVFNMEASAAALEGEGVGKFLMMEPPLELGMVRAINALNIDGVFINIGQEAFITIEHLLVCQRFSELLDKPLLTNLPSLITNAELGSLWKAGVNGVVVPFAQPLEDFAKLKEMINNLPKGTKHRRGKAVNVVIPHYMGEIATEEEEEEEI